MAGSFTPPAHKLPLSVEIFEHKEENPKTGEWPHPPLMVYKKSQKPVNDHLHCWWYIE